MMKRFMQRVLRVLQFYSLKEAKLNDFACFA